VPRLQHGADFLDFGRGVCEDMNQHDVRAAASRLSRCSPAVRMRTSSAVFTVATDTGTFLSHA
jgi:hypothetical protein